MSKELESVKGVNIINQYHSKQVDNFTRVVLGVYKGEKPIKHYYYELVNKRGKVVQSIPVNSKENDKYVIQSIAVRLGLNYRLVEFEEVWQDLDKEEKNEPSR